MVVSVKSQSMSGSSKLHSPYDSESDDQYSDVQDSAYYSYYEEEYHKKKEQKVKITDETLLEYASFF